MNCNFNDVSEAFGESMQGIKRKNYRHTGKAKRQSGHFDDSSSVATEEIIQRVLKSYQHYTPPVQLVTCGRWAVPVEKRPRNWESMGIPE